MVKLGYSREALDVMVFHGVSDLAAKLEAITEQTGCLVDSVFIQDFMPSDCEIRCSQFHARHLTHSWMRCNGQPFAQQQFV